MKKKSTFQLKQKLCLLFMVTCVFSFALKAQVVTINGAGSYATISAAVAAASSGDVIQVSAGTYPEVLNISKDLIIRGSNAGIPGNGTRNPEAIISNGKLNILGNNTVVFDGFKIYQTNDVSAVSLGGGATATIQHNIIERFGVNPGIQTARGIEISAGAGVKTIANNLFTGDVSGGLFGGHKTWQSGMYINAAGSTVNVTGNVFQNCRTAMNIDDMSAGINLSGNTFSNNGTFISFGGVSPSTGSFTLGANNYNNLVSTFINLSNVAASFRLDISAGTYAGTPFSAMTLADLFGIESTMYHRTRSGRLGLVYYVPNQQYVLAAVNNSIQTAVDYASVGDVINVQAGTYTQSPNINKSVTLKGANAGTSGCATRSAESVIQGAFTIGTDGITIDGFEFTGANAQIASTAGATVRSNITIINNYLHATTAQIPIRHGLGLGGGIGSTNWIVSNNKISDIQFANATAIAVFNVTNATINNNCIAHTNAAFGGRRGINADGLQTATINGNTIDMGEPAPSVATNPNTPWAIQISMSDRPVTDLNINENEVSNTYYAIVGLSQRSFTNSSILRNTTNNVYRSLTLNSGATVPQVTNTLMGNLQVKNNFFNAIQYAIYLRDLHNAAPNGPVQFNNIQINKNSLLSGAEGIYADAGLTINDGQIHGTCNWYGTNVAAAVAAKINGNVTYIPYLSDGTDGSTAIGFQPTAVCSTCTLSAVSLGNNRFVFFGIAGLPGASGTLTPVITGGLAPFSYSWSSTDASVNGSTAASVTPSGYTDAQSFSYTVTVTDANGCTATATVTITYFNINCSSNANNVKVKVCHIPQGNPTNCNTICVSVNAYQALLNSGSYLGNCLPNCEVPATRGVADISNYIVGNQDLKVKVFNNPTENHFRIYVSGDLYEKVSIRVLDVYGRVVEQRQNIKPDQEIRFGDRFVSGSYMVEVVQGTSKKVIQLVKR